MKPAIEFDMHTKENVGLDCKVEPASIKGHPGPSTENLCYILTEAIISSLTSFDNKSANHVP